MALLTTKSEPGIAGGVHHTGVESLCVHCGLQIPRARRRGGHGARFCCFGCRFAYGLAQPSEGSFPNTFGVDHSDAISDGANTLLLRLGLGIFLAMNIMVFSWAFYSCEWYTQGTGRHDSLAGLFAYLLLLLSTVLIAALGMPLAADAMGQVFTPDRTLGATSARPLGIRNRGCAAGVLSWLRAVGRVRLDTNALICIGVGGAYLISVIHTLQGRGSLYYDTAAMILVLVTLGYFLESAAKRKASGVARSLMEPLAPRVRVRRHGEEVHIKSDQVIVGDRVYTRAGECFVVDALVVEGAGRVDESSLTGESQPRSVEPGHAVLAGTVNLDGPLWTQAQRVGDDRVIHQTQRLLEEARMRQLPIQRLADCAASVFVPSVLVLTAGVLVWHAIHGDATRGLFDALSVLLISCPCALGLAAPLAAWSALRRAAEHGVIIDSAATLERIATIDRVYFDKTGTLTQGYLSLHQIVVADGIDQDQALRWAAALEATSVHPIARSLVAEAQQRGLKLPSVGVAKTLPGLGVEARIVDQMMRLGSARLADSTGLNVTPFDEAYLSQDASNGTAVACTKIYLLDASRVLARFDLAEQLRNEAAEAVVRLKEMGIAVEMLSGDQPAPAKQIARSLNIPFEGALLPAEKIERVADAQRCGGRVAMVGDGINDGPVLAVAEVGFVMSSGTDLAKQAGHVWLLVDRLDRIPMTIAIARHCMKRVRLNLAWAFGYNLIGLTLAAGGLLTPIISALAMIASSLMIVATSRSAGRIHQADDLARTIPTKSENERTVSPSESNNLKDRPRPVMGQTIVSQV